MLLPLTVTFPGVAPPISGTGPTPGVRLVVTPPVVVTAVICANASPAGMTSIRLNPLVTPSGTFTVSRYEAVSPITAWLALLVASLIDVPTSVFATVGPRTVTLAGSVSGALAMKFVPLAWPL